MIPKNISRNHVLTAIAETRKGGIPDNRSSKKFLLEYEGNFYPPKYVISRANHYANGEELNPEAFSGGAESNKFLISRGFRIVPVAHSTPKPSKPTPTTPIKSIVNAPIAPIVSPDTTARHDEHCRECKRIILLMLEKAYGEAKLNYRLDFKVTPESFKNTKQYKVLAEIFKALQSHRGFTDFIKSDRLPPFDFFVPRPGFIIEFDESQHFTKPREIALSLYPDDFSLGYDKKVWVQRCQTLNKRDNDLPFRDEQRAWYDTLRDFCCNLKGIPIIRLLPEEAKWCGMNPKDNVDVVNFKKIIEQKMEQTTSKSDPARGSFKVGLVFPEIEKHSLKHLIPQIDRYGGFLNLLVFPEGFETITTKREQTPEMLLDSDEMNPIRVRYAELSHRLSLSIIVGVQVYCRKVFNMGGHDQYCLCVQPDGGSCIYHKHSTSRLKAFFDTKWSIKDNFPVMDIAGKRVGMSICHDMYISLIPRLLKSKGAGIWVNLTGQNVRTHIWEAVLRARAAENHLFAVCTLHRSSDKSNPQKEPYAFSAKGKIRLKDLSTGKDISLIEERGRVGKIFFFDTADYAISQPKPKESSDLPDKAERIVLSLKNNNVAIQDGKKRYWISEISMTDFLNFPEKLWQTCLDHRDAVAIFMIQTVEDDWAKHKTHAEAVLWRG